MTDAPDEPDLAAEPDDEETEAELDPRVSTPDDGIEDGDDLDSEAVQDQLDTDPDAFNAEVADVEDEH